MRPIAGLQRGALRGNYRDEQEPAREQPMTEKGGRVRAVLDGGS